MAGDRSPWLVYLYGPPAVGKLTVARRVCDLTGARLFHNHLTVDAVASVFPFRSEPFTEVLHRLRLDVFATAARSGVDVVFTNNSAWGGRDARARFAAFAAAAARAVGDNGGRTLFVALTAPAPVLEARVAGDDRRARGKLVDATRLREVLAEHDPAPLHDDDLVIDTGRVTAEEAAARIAGAFDG